jgi:hypothetical protein
MTRDTWLARLRHLWITSQVNFGGTSRVSLGVIPQVKYKLGKCKCIVHSGVILRPEAVCQVVFIILYKSYLLHMWWDIMIEVERDKEWTSCLTTLFGIAEDNKLISGLTSLNIYGIKVSSFLYEDNLYLDVDMRWFNSHTPITTLDILHIKGSLYPNMT